MAAIGLASNRLTSQMDTVSILIAQYGGKAVVPLDIVCRDYFAPLTVPTLMRKISAGEIELVLIRVEHSRKSSKGVRIQDLACFIDAKAAADAVQVRARSRQTLHADTASLVSAKSLGGRSVPIPVAHSDRQGEVQPAMERALTLRLAAELLGVSYGTVYAHREALGFFQIGAVWRVWPDTLRMRLGAKQEEKARSRGKAATPAFKGSPPSYAPSLDAQKAAKELTDLLENRLSRRRRKADGK